jgi:hypothetical protein
MSSASRPAEGVQGGNTHKPGCGAPAQANCPCALDSSDGESYEWPGPGQSLTMSGRRDARGLTDESRAVRWNQRVASL